MLRFDSRIEFIDVDDGRFIVTLKPGFACQDANTSIACHTFGADSHKEIREQLREDVVPCACPECVLAQKGG